MEGFGPRFNRALTQFVEAHQEDDQQVVVDGEQMTGAEAYHRKVVHWLQRLQPDASEPLQLAAHCQHIRRWTLPRSDFPGGVVGYKRWRSTLARFHADQAAAILSAVGYGSDVVARVQDLLLKKRLRSDPETQALEDAVCLTFLESQLSTFAGRHDQEQVISILRKTWAKMGDGGRRAAQELLPKLEPQARVLVEAALSG